MNSDIPFILAVSFLFLTFSHLGKAQWRLRQLPAFKYYPKIQIIRFCFCSILIQICAGAKRMEEFVRNISVLRRVGWVNLWSTMHWVTSTSGHKCIHNWLKFLIVTSGLVSGMPCNNWSPARTNTYFELRQMYKYATAQTWKKIKHLNIQVCKWMYMQISLTLLTFALSHKHGLGLCLSGFFLVFTILVQADLLYHSP